MVGLSSLIWFWSILSNHSIHDQQYHRNQWYSIWLLYRWIMWMNNNESISKTNQVHTTESIGWFISLSILINGTGLKRWIDSFRHSYSSAFVISYLWSSDIEEYSIPSKCRNVEERLILLITATIKNQTHPIWFNDNYQIE